MRNYLIRHPFFEEADKSIEFDPPNRKKIDHIRKLGDHFLNRLEQEFNKSVNERHINESQRQLYELIERLQVFMGYDISKLSAILYNVNEQNRQLSDAEIDEVDRLDDRKELWSEFDGVLDIVFHRITKIIPDRSNDLPLIFIAGIFVFRGTVIEKNRDSDYSKYLAEFNYQGKGSKLYIDYTEWLRNMRTKILPEKLKRHIPGIIKYLQKSDPEAARKASEYL